MACPAPFDAFRLATESLPDIAYVQGTFRDIWMNLIIRGEWPQSAGLVRSVFNIGRSEPTTDEPDFDPIVLSDGDTYTGSCGTVYNEINYGYNETTYGPERFGWKGPPVCQDDLIFNYKAAMFLEKYIPAMTKNTLRTIGNRFAAIYAHFVPKAVAADDFGFGDPGTGTPPQHPVINLGPTDCELSQSHLDITAEELNEIGAFEPNTNGWIELGETGPLYPLLIGQAMSNKILLNNAELREDRRHADSGKGDMAMLFQRIGATRVIKNFRHLVTVHPPRYTWGIGGYTRVATWEMVAGTKGFVARTTAAWRNAAYEGAYVLNPWVFHSEAIRPVNSAAGLNWEPKSYMGELSFETGGERIFDPPCHDPRHKLGRHFGEFAHAPKPIFPEYGRLIIYRRCLDNAGCETCS